MMKRVTAREINDWEQNLRMSDYLPPDKAQRLLAEVRRLRGLLSVCLGSGAQSNEALTAEVVAIRTEA